MAKGDTYKCTGCAAIYDTEYKFCPQCGKPVEKVITKKKCYACGAILHDGTKFCPMCGKYVFRTTRVYTGEKLVDSLWMKERQLRWLPTPSTTPAANSEGVFKKLLKLLRLLLPQRPNP